MESISGLIIPIGTIFLIVLVQISFWFPTGIKQPAETSEIPSTENTDTTSVSKQNDRPEVREPSNTQQGRPVVAGGGVSHRIILQGIRPENPHCIFIRDDSSSSSESAEARNPQEISSNAVDTSIKKATTIQNVQGRNRLWKCSCELGFLPSGLLKTFGNAEAIVRLGTGQCYHKK
mmetsp:Transcript_32908/g.68727  ORF Transcript_32908/g.68727 Transcript_32908/m.68727 type:complete len:176 (+) Transcript_32908:62-589(+)